MPSNSPRPTPRSKKPYEIQIKDIRLTRLLGEGGYGTVWFGKWCGNGGGQVAAIKTLTASKPLPGTQGHSAEAPQVDMLSPGALEEFESQMELLHTASHTNVARIFGACIDPNQTLCIVEEFAEHGNLFDVLHNSSINLEWWLRWKMAKQLVMGLNFLHSFGITHCHLSSFNVLVADRWDIKICDIGLNQVRQETCQFLMMNPSKSSPPSIGAASVRWRAPETMCRNPQWNEQTDIYSMGIVMWEIVTRNIPFHDVSDNYLIPIIVRMDHERPLIPSDCPALLANIIQQCWSANPEERPSCETILESMNQEDDQLPEQPNSLP